MLDVNRLRVLAAVAEHGSVTAAARALNYSQPSVSHHLARLEAETGATLLRKVGRGVRLTHEGETLARRAAEIMGRVQAADDELASMVGLQRGRVRLAAFQSAMSTLVPVAAAALRREHDGLALEFVDCHPSRARQMLRDGVVDVAILFDYDDRTDGRHPNDDGVHQVQLLDDPMYLISTREDDRLIDHRDDTWIGGCPDCRGDLVAACHRAGFDPSISYTSDDVIATQALVAAGVGVTTLPGLALRSFRSPDVCVTAVPNFRRRLSVATYGEPPLPRSVAVLVDALTEAATTVAPDVAPGVAPDDRVTSRAGAPAG